MYVIFPGHMNNMKLSWFNENYKYNTDFCEQEIQNDYAFIVLLTTQQVRLISKLEEATVKYKKRHQGH